MNKPVSIEPSHLYDEGTLQLATGLAPATLAKARRSGRLRYTRQGKRVLYLGRWILDWLEVESRQGVGVE
ncbi:MAG: hypothetical protein ABIK89_05970 [Planctomycetota bacterium]